MPRARNKPALPLVVLALLFAGAGPAAAKVAIVLQDGQVLAGVSLELKDDNYQLELEGDAGTLALPAGLVKEIRFYDTSRPAAVDAATGEPVPEPSDEERDRFPRELTRDPTEEDPDPRRPDPRTPSPAEQVRAFGRPPAEFQRGAVDTRWRYEDVLGRETDVTQFNPARWYRPPLESTWKPTSAYENTSVYPGFNPARWYRPGTRSTWFPRDAFGETEWFPPVVSTRD